MLKLRELRNEIKAFISERMPDINVEYGKVGELTIEPPGILIYIQPDTERIRNSNEHPIFRKAKVTLFSVVNSEMNASDSVISAIELLEEVEKYILTSEFQNYLSACNKNSNNYNTQIEYAEGNWLSFEGYYNNNAIAALELIFDYCTVF